MPSPLEGNPVVEGNPLNYFNYFTEIEDTFIRRRGKHLMLSPLDWALIEDWRERGIPLHIVIRSIESVFDVFDKQPERPRTIKSLFYCREEIEAQYTEWLKIQVGSDGGGTASNDKELDAETFSKGAIASHVENAAVAIKGVHSAADGELKIALGRAILRLEELLASSDTAERLEKSLENIDSLIDEGLLSAANAPAVKDEIRSQLAPYKKRMEAEVYERTFDLMLIKRLRESAGIPRLSLFYL